MTFQNKGEIYRSKIQQMCVCVGARDNQTMGKNSNKKKSDFLRCVFVYGMSKTDERQSERGLSYWCARSVLNIRRKKMNIMDGVQCKIIDLTNALLCGVPLLGFFFWSF